MAPARRAAVIVLTNSDGVGSAGLAARLLRIVLGLPGERKEGAVDPTIYTGYVGTYKLMDTSITIGRDAERLTMEIGGRPMALLPDSVHDFVLGDTEVEITFVTDATGRATELIAHEGGFDTHFGRVQ
jgi:hypothetical protein